MNTARTHLARFLADERGSSAVEYGLLCALMVLAVIGSITAVGSASSEHYNTVAESFPA